MRTHQFSTVMASVHMKARRLLLGVFMYAYNYIDIP